MLVHTSGGDVRLGYCTNVHPAETLEGVRRSLEEVAARVARRVAGGAPMGVGLWLAAPVVRELADERRRASFRRLLEARTLQAYTLNAFPYGGFHAARVKEAVFRPTWLEPERLDYTLRAAEVLSDLLPAGERGSVSTHTGQWRAWGDGPEVRRALAARMLECARGLEALERRTGRWVALALEPEPLSTLETTEEVVDFFEREVPPEARRHLGVCYDVCHQAVQFEDPEAALSMLEEARVPVHKAQLSSALQVERPGEDPEAVRALAAWTEPRYLHQVVGLAGDGRRMRASDLEGFFPPAAAWLEAERWRCHFHVPVHLERVGGLATTRDELGRALAALVRRQTTDHLEVETYTWAAVAGAPGSETLAEGLALELEWCRAGLEAAGVAPAGGR